MQYFEKGKELGLDEAVLVEPVCWSETDTHDIEGTETCMRQCRNTVWTQSVFQTLSFQTLRVTRVCTLLTRTSQPFRESISTGPPTTRHRRSGPQKTMKKDIVWTRVSRRHHSKTNGRLIGLRVCPSVRFNDYKTSCVTWFLNHTYLMLSIIYYWLQHAILWLVYTAYDQGSHMTMNNYIQVGLYQTPSPIPPIPPLMYYGRHSTTGVLVCSTVTVTVYRKLPVVGVDKFWWTSKVEFKMLQRQSGGQVLGELVITVHNT
jgi:hypothetical protein